MVFDYSDWLVAGALLQVSAFARHVELVGRVLASGYPPGQVLRPKRVRMYHIWLVTI